VKIDGEAIERVVADLSKKGSCEGKKSRPGIAAGLINWFRDQGRFLEKRSFLARYKDIVRDKEGAAKKLERNAWYASETSCCFK